VRALAAVARRGARLIPWPVNDPVMVGLALAVLLTLAVLG